ncbi:glycoside hydrolase [Heliocybe sulcata]|uniref:Glycoside hydrolase n=1 Tax=Heliocybe sulcata TaxID=5364 RepID=A0A5C3N4C9_9AGAM|nr:glycoside hydrolase [Heliocybe sulcata]
MMSYLKVEGTKIVGSDGKEIILRGAALGGWMLMENFIVGYPSVEFQIREALAEVIGPQKSEFFFDKFLEYFFTEPDAQFFKSLSLNCIRIAISYRHFEDDANPRVLKPEGFKHLDRVIALCAKYQIYTIIDMHSAPGGQNGGWHCDAGIHIPTFWMHKDFQDRLVWLWREIARHYKDNPWIAGYNPMNEPSDPTHTRLIDFYDRVYAAIREEDPRHIIFFDGNTYSIDFSAFPEDAKDRWPNSAYSIHDYAVYGFPKAPEPYEDTAAQRDLIRKTYMRKRAWMDERGLCVWNGEWGPVYARKDFEGDNWEEINDRRMKVLRYQLELYKKDQLSWSIWLYKDIGFQGMVYVSKETPYMKLFENFLQKKWRLAVDAWGADDRHVRHLYDPLVNLIKESVSNEKHLNLYPPIWGVEGRVTRLARTMLLGEYLVKEWAEHFKGMDEEELDRLAQSFKFENCMKREGLNKELMENAE